jgi:hypothetical protein
MNLHYVSSAVTSFFWLKPGTCAIYTFSDGMLGFDDRGWANPVRGNYSWLCVEVNATHAVLDVEVNFEVFNVISPPPFGESPGHITYTGKEFVEKASRGDLSFIKRVPMDQVIGRVEITNETTHYAVKIPSPIFISRSFRVVVDLDSMEMIDEGGRPWGKWILWIDPLKYPLEGRTEELFVMNWLNTTIYLNVTYNYQSIPRDTIFGQVNTYFFAQPWRFIENNFLQELGIEGVLAILPSYTYEPRTGIFLQTTGLDYLDDILTQKFGIVKTMLHVWPQPLLYLSSISFCGDLNSDWAVNIHDIFIVAKAFGSKEGDENWNSLADANKDGIVNVKDIFIVAKMFGTQYITTD